MSIDAPPSAAAQPEPITESAGHRASKPPPLPPDDAEQGPPGGWLGWWHATPLYTRILAACVLAVLVGLALRYRLPVPFFRELRPLLPVAEALAIPSRLILRLLTALAAPLVLCAVLHALMTAQLPRGSGWRLLSLLLLN